MRSLACLGLLLTMALASGCETDSPAQLVERNISLDFSAPDAVVPRWGVWDLTEDSDGEPGPDDVNDDGRADDWLWCERAPVPNQNATASSVPWTYSLQVSVLPAGGVDFVPITSPAALQNGSNRAAYDTIVTFNPINRPAQFNVVHKRGQCSINHDILCNPASTSPFCDENDAGICEPVYACTADTDLICNPANSGTTCSSQGAGVCTPAGTCSGNPGLVCIPTCGELGLGSCAQPPVVRKFFLNEVSKRRITSANAEFIRPPGNIVNSTCAGGSCTGLPPGIVLPGLCPSTSNGPPLIDQQAPPFSFQLLKGETMLVEARRLLSQPSGITFTQTPRIRAAVTIDGLLAQPQDLCPPEDLQCIVTEQNSTSQIKFFFVSK